MSTPKITQRLDLRQAQQLVMTPQLQQAIKLLQLNNIELGEFIEEELAQNPLLEKSESENTDNNEPHESTQPEARDEVQSEFDEGWTGNEAETPKASSDFDIGTAHMGTGGSRNFDEMDESFENRMQTQKTLREYLNEQLAVAFNDPTDLAIGGLLIDQLDESGYLRSDHHEMAQQLGVKDDRLEKILKIMKGFDPTGVFAGNLAECLAIQLDEKDALDAPMRKLLDNLELLGKHDHKKLCDICGVNRTYLDDMIAEIRTLNPKPAAEFEHTIVQTAIPDVLMKRLPKNLGGGWRVELNSETLPKVLVNQNYYTEVSQHATQKKDKEYLANQLNSASWLVRALDQRAQTILKTASAIIEEQDAFFNYGIEFLKPLTLKNIAETIQMHESTVSRVTTNKYIGTPRGIFELKFFFSTAIISEDGSTHSAEAVKARIKTLIDTENPDKILSDDSIVDLLKNEGIDLARRTVAKYREGLNIASSVQRRRQKKN
jgi:RNA polymerase sigma-54 factor